METIYFSGIRATQWLCFSHHPRVGRCCLPFHNLHRLYWHKKNSKLIHSICKYDSQSQKAVNKSSNQNRTPKRTTVYRLRSLSLSFPYCLFPLNRARRLGCNIIYHSIHTTHGIADLGGYISEEIWFERIPIGRHSIRGCHSSKSYNMRMSALITLDTCIEVRGGE